MKYYEKLLALGCVTRSQLEQVTGSPSAADWLCREYQRKGYMESVCCYQSGNRSVCCKPISDCLSHQ